jgi:ribonuclease J
MTKPTEWDLNYDAAFEFLAEVNGDFIKAHVSGHAYVADIVSFVNSVNARTVIPIHTFEPQMYREHFSNVHLLTDGEVYEIA